MVLIEKRLSSRTQIRRSAGYVSIRLILLNVGVIGLIGVTGTSVAQATESLNVHAQAPSIERIAGHDRYDESVLISQRIAPSNSRIVYLASGEGFADALSGSALAAQHHAPLLLTTSISVPDVVAAEVSRLAPTEIVVLGGERAISSTVIDRLRSLRPGASISRIGGADRYEVSRNAIADSRYGSTIHTQDVYMVNGQNFPDALSASPAAASISSPVLLVDGSAISLTEIETTFIAGGITNVTIFGGRSAFSEGLQQNVSTYIDSVTRIDGEDRYKVSAHVASTLFSSRAPVKTVYIASGANFPDGLTGGVLAGIAHAPIFLSNGTCIDPEVSAQIALLHAENVVLLGGVTALSNEVAALRVCNT